MLKKTLNLKVSIKTLLIVIYLCLIFALLFGWSVKHIMMGGERFGNWKYLILDLASIPTTAKRFFENKDHGLLVKNHKFKDSLAWQIDLDKYKLDENKGYLLISRFDGDKSRSLVELFDINDEKIIHTWSPNIKNINSKSKISKKYLDFEKNLNINRYRMQHPLLLKNGSIIFQGNSPLTRINICSKLNWTLDGIFHHSNELGNNNSLWTPHRFRPSSITTGSSLIANKESFQDDALSQISHSGEILFNKSITQILIDNNLEYLIYPTGEWGEDPLHLNDIQPILKDGKYWKSGDVFFSLRNINSIFLYRPNNNKIIWYKDGPWRRQHDIDIFSDEEISIFDNNVNFDLSNVDGVNQIILYNFKNDNIRLYQEASFKDYSIKTTFEGLHSIFPNGDLMLEETENGRIVMFANDGSLKWQYINKSKNGDVYRMNWSRFLDGQKYFDIVKNINDKKNVCN